MSDRIVAFVDDARLLADLSASPGTVAVSLDTQATRDLAAKSTCVRSILEYSQSFPSYDELYAHFETVLRERLRPKDSSRQSTFLFDALWDDILLGLTPTHYVESLVREVLRRERPTRVVFAIADRELDALFRRIVEHAS